MQNFAAHIKELRKEENLSQKEFSQKLLISQSYLSGLESGREVPSNKLVKLICLEFGVSESWLARDGQTMYEDFFENNKENLADTSNMAILQIMQLLSTKSNVEYGFYAYSLLFLTDSLIKINRLEEEDKLVLLESTQCCLALFDRLLKFAINDKLSNATNDLSSLRQELVQQIDEIVGFFTSDGEKIPDYSEFATNVHDKSNL